MSDDRPVLRVISGNPSPEELAVLTAVMTATGSAAPADTAPTRGRWNDPAALMRRPLRAGPGGWQAALR